MTTRAPGQSRPDDPAAPGPSAETREAAEREAAEKSWRRDVLDPALATQEERQ